MHTYRHEMNEDEHATLLSRVREVDGMVLLSGYDHEMYHDTLKDWVCETFDTHADQAMPRTESLWINPAAMARRTTQSALF